MNQFFEAAWEIHRFLVERGVPYAVIGGFAVQRWGEPRFTRDVDLTIAAPLEENSAGLTNAITSQFASRTTDPVEFARRSRMILVTATNGVDLDISLALPGYEYELFARAVDHELEPGKRIRLCSAEDLVIHKAVAGRPQDILDIQGVIYRQAGKLDLEYIRQWLSQFDQVLEEPQALQHFEGVWRNYLEGRQGE